MSKKSRQRATIADVARLAGVSISTVSRVVNATAPVSDDVEQRVRSAIDLLGYSPHVAARNLAVKHTNTIGLMLPELSSSFFAPLLRGIEAAVRRTDYDLLIYANPRATHQGNLRRPQAIAEHNADGTIVFSTILDEREVIRNYERGFPMVLLHRIAPRGVEIPCVNFDNRHGVRLLIDHLVQIHGRRQIAFLQGPEGNQDSEQREQSYREALDAHGIRFDSSRVARGGFNEPGGQAAVEQLLRLHVPFDAVFSGDDEAAIGAMSALRNAGLCVPEDVAVVGFDDLPVVRHLNPPLTTVRAPIEQAGYQAATQLFRLLETGQAELNTLLPVELVIRQSCGCT